MTAFTDFKQMEGARIMPLMGALGTLPGAALVLNKAGSECGAPLFMAALVFLAGAYLMWLCSDASFATSYENEAVGNALLAKKQEGVGYYFSWATLLYGIASLASTVLGFAGIHSSLRGPLSVNDGFLVVFGLTLAIAIHCGHSIFLRNGIDQMTAGD